MFYVYFWLREDGTPYYVGKGKDGRDSRAYINWGHNVSRPKDLSKVIVQTHESEDDAFIAEKFFISLYGRKDLGTGCLRNLTEGGEGLAGTVRTEEWNRKISLATKGRKATSYPRTAEHRRQLQERLQGNKCGVGNRGRDMSLETPEQRFKRVAGIKAAWAAGKYATRRKCAHAG